MAPTTPEAATAMCLPLFLKGVYTARSNNSAVKKATALATAIKGLETNQEIVAPTTIAKADHFQLVSSCNQSLNTRARPIIRTPEGAIKPNPTGIRQGPLSKQTDPKLPIK